MADKQAVRPQGLDPSWSNSLNLSDPGEAWDLTVSKVEPGAGKRDDGWLPEENPAAQHLNHLFNEIGRWLQFFSNLQHQNWGSPTKVASITPNNAGNAITRDMGAPNGGIWLTCGNGGTVLSSVDGFEWLDVNATTALYDWAASKDPRDTPAVAGTCSIFGGRSQASVIDYVLGVVSTTSLPGGGFAFNGIWSNAASLFVAAGHDGAGTWSPKIWTSGPNPVSWTARTVTKNQSEYIVDLAGGNNGTNEVVCCVGDIASTGGTAADVFWSLDGINWNTVNDVFPLATGEPRCIAYNKDTGVWTVLCGTLGAVYTSTDCLSWSLVGTAGFDALPRSLHSRGSLLLVPEDGAQVLHASTDGGVTWTHQGIDFDLQISTPSDVSGLAYAEDIEAFGLLMTGGYPATTHAAQFRQSLSCGTVLTKTDATGAVVLYTPTVT